MMETPSGKITPGGSRKRKSPTAKSGATRPLDSGEPGTSCREESELPRTSSQKIRTRQKYLLGTLNINTLLQVGKLKQLTNVLKERNICILALQETRYLDENPMESEGFRIYKGKPGVKNNANATILGTAFIVKRDVTESVISFSSPTERISLLSIRSGNKAYTIINAHAPINDDNKKNPEKVGDFWETLEDTTSKIPQHHVKVLVGDFNAQIGREKKYRKIVGDYPAHKRTNKNGERLIGFCRQFNLKLMSTHFKALPSKKKTWVSPNMMMGEFQIDHVAVTAKNRKEVLNVKVRKSLNINSDHYLSEIKVRFQPNKPKPRTKRKPRVNAAFLQQNKEKYIENLDKLDMNTWEEIRESITKAAGDLGKPSRKRKHRWWNEKCDEALDRRLQSWKKWHSNKTEKRFEEFREERKRAAKIIRTEKRNYDRSRVEQIEEEFKQKNSREFYRTFKEELQGYQPPSLCFKRIDGSVATSDKENCQLLADYFKSLLNGEEPGERLGAENISQENPDSQPPTLNEIKRIIKELKNNKAPGEDGIIAEMWKFGGEITAKTIHHVIEEIWKTGRIPDDWKCALIHPLHKKGNRMDINNYRGISLLPVAYKILSKALLNRVEDQVDHLIGEYQAGFRKGRSCVEQIFNLKSILRTRALRGQNTVIVFVDFKKAYDSIDRRTLFNALEEFGIDRKTREIIKQTLTDTISKVKFHGEVSDPFEIKTGVRQGDGLSPILFNIILEKIMRNWEKALEAEGIQGIHLGRKGQNLEIKCLAFADDLALLAHNKDDAQKMLDTLHEIAEKTGLKVSYEKTEYMEYRHHEERHMKVEHGTVKRTDKFKYLGEWIQPNGLDKEANKARARKLDLAYRLTQNRYNKRAISYKAKLRHYSTVVKPEGLYASECLTLNKKGELKELELKERKILRKILGPRKSVDGTWKKRKNEDLYMQTENIVVTMRKRRLKFYGHLVRMDENRLTKKIFKYITGLKATTKWVEEVKRDASEVGLTELVIHDRKMFRSRVDSIKNFKEKPPQNRPKLVISEEQRKIRSERMKRFWEEKKKRLTRKP